MGEARKENEEKSKTSTAKGSPFGENSEDQRNQIQTCTRESHQSRRTRTEGRASCCIKEEEKDGKVTEREEKRVAAEARQAAEEAEDEKEEVEEDKREAQEKVREEK